MDNSETFELVSADAQGEVDLAVRDITTLLETARRQAARSVNALMTATYWQIGRRIVEFEQGGKERAGYGEKLIERLSADLTVKFGRGFSYRNLAQMRQFYNDWQILQTVSAESATETPDKLIVQTLPGQLEVEALAPKFPLSWSHYVKLLSVENPNARAFYETETLRGGWSLRQLDRQI